jgi:hypothetical protein
VALADDPDLHRANGRSMKAAKLPRHCLDGLAGQRRDALYAGLRRVDVAAELAMREP